MIQATWNTNEHHLTVRDHDSGEGKVCAAVSSMLATLFVCYGAPQPERGFFVWTVPSESIVSIAAAQFVVNALRVLATKHPDELRLEIDGVDCRELRS